jgi:hypothetical protein
MPEKDKNRSFEGAATPRKEPKWDGGGGGVGSIFHAISRAQEPTRAVIPLRVAARRLELNYCQSRERGSLKSGSCF